MIRSRTGSSRVLRHTKTSKHCEPCSKSLSWGHARLREIDFDALLYLLRIVVGEREYTQYGFDSFIDRGAPDGVQPDVAIAGGLTQMDKIATLAKNAGIPIYPHGYSTDVIIAANLHVIAANENAPLLEYCVEDSPLRWELVEESFELIDGEVTIPDRPGLSITLNRDALAEYAVELWTDW